jgi:uracil-DNA glycosylase
MIDRPRLFRDRNEVAIREKDIFSTKVAPLNHWVQNLRDRLGPDVIIPWFDPCDGGCEAKILWLLEAPGPMATSERGGSGFVSCNNNDGTAQNSWQTRVDADVPRQIVVHWNVIPYYLGSNTRIRAHNPTDIAAVGPLIIELLYLLSQLQVVLLGGEAARKVWEGYAPKHTNLQSITCPHPSATNLNTRPEYRVRIIDAWRAAFRCAEG